MTGKPDEIVLSFGKQNCNQANMISSWSDHANAKLRHGQMYLKVIMEYYHAIFLYWPLLI